MYEAARKLPDSKYVKPWVRVPLKEWESILDFSHIYGYRLTKKALAALDAQKNSVIKVSPAGVKEATYEEHRPEDMLKSGSNTEVLPDLMDSE